MLKNTTSLGLFHMKINVAWGPTDRVSQVNRDSERVIKSLEQRATIQNSARAYRREAR